MLNRIKKNVYTARNKALKVLGVTALAAGMLWSGTKGSKPISVPAYYASRIIDGDTFETTEKQLIRLAHTSAPELDLCGGIEAQKQLETLIMGKPLYLKVIYRDPYMRLISLVYAESLFVNQAMIESGYAYYALSNGPGEPSLKSANAKAREAQKGIFSSRCTQKVNPVDRSCTIKGNKRLRKDSSIYHFPGCSQYNNALVQLYLGDEWFCTEKEAQTQGYRKAEDCPESFIPPR